MSKKKKILETFALAWGFSAIISIVFYLITHFNKAIVFFEPIVWVRIVEIIFSLISLPILIFMLVKSNL